MKSKNLIILAVILLDCFYSFGSHLNGYPLLNSLLSGALRLILEIILIRKASAGSLPAYWVVAILWMAGAIVSFYYLFRVDVMYAKVGLTLVSLGQLLLIFWLGFLYRSSKTTAK